MNETKHGAKHSVVGRSFFMRRVKAESLRWHTVPPIHRLGGTSVVSEGHFGDSRHRAVTIIIGLHSARSRASDTVPRSIAWAETGLIVVLDGLIGELLCFV